MSGWTGAKPQAWSMAGWRDDRIGDGGTSRLAPRRQDAKSAKVKSLLGVLASWRAIFFLVLLQAATAAAHPMGNFSINHFTSITIERKFVQVKLRVDLAEVPTAQELLFLDLNQDGKISAEEKENYLKNRVGGLTKLQRILINGKECEFQVQRLDLIGRGENGHVTTMLLVADYRVAMPKLRENPVASDRANENVIEYADSSFDGRAGWREIAAYHGSDVNILECDVPVREKSSGFLQYNTGVAPPQITHARIVFSVDPEEATTTAPIETARGLPSAANKGSGDSVTQVTRAGDEVPRTSVVGTDRFLKLLGDGKTPTILILLSLPIAMVLGAMHALSPGHGKTVVAAYLVGSRGTSWHALLLGIVVTITHTAGVFALGLIVLFAAGKVIPEKLYPWLGFASGALIFCIGAWQLTRRLAMNYSRVVDTHGHTHELPEGLSFFGLVALGVSGGLVPCPSALVLMLSAIALKRTLVGLILIVGFSFGLAAVLIAIGMAVLYSQSLLKKWKFEAEVAGKLRIVSAAVVAIVGVVMAWVALRSGGIV